jgi:hypothetical protein
MQAKPMLINKVTLICSMLHAKYKTKQLLNGFYGALFYKILADGSEVLGISSESPAGQRWPMLYKQYLRMLDPQSPFDR